MSVEKINVDGIIKDELSKLHIPMVKNYNKMNHFLIKNDIQIDFTQYGIRNITPKESWRLMGIDDNAFKSASSLYNKDKPLYKQAGNAIVVDVMVEIFRSLFKC